MTNIPRLAKNIKQFHTERAELESKLENLYDSPASDAPQRIRECLWRLEYLKEECNRLVLQIDNYLTSTRKMR